MVQPWWHPEQLARRRPFLEARAAVTSAVRAYFKAEGFIAVETPALQRAPGLERHIRPFATTLREPLDEAKGPRFLHTSPEFAMKKLLAGGMGKIVQLCHVFRDGERSPLHQPEFMMLEWYRAHATYDALIDDCAAILTHAGKAASRALAHDGLFRWGGRVCDPAARPERLTVQEAFARFAGINLLATVTDADAPDAKPLADAARATGVQCGANDTWEDVFFHVMLARIEPHLGIDRATVLTEYPAHLAALARRKPGDTAVAERFELYVCGVELANAYSELTDAAEQRTRFARDHALHRSLYGNAPPIDEDLLDALCTLPECAGAALGFDRLVMLAANARDISEVLWAPVL